MNKNTVILISTLLAISLVVTYLIIGDQKESVVRVISPPTIIASLPIWVAEEKKLFSKRGLKIEPISLTNSRLMVEAMLADNVDVLPAVSLADLATTGYPGNGALMHALIYSHSRMVKNPSFESILVATNSPISTLTDFEGKKIAVYPGSTSELAIDFFLKKNGVNTQNVTYVKLPPPEHEPALLKGDVQAIHVYEPFRTLALQNGKSREFSSSVYAALNEPSGIGCSAISRKFYRGSPEAAQKFFEAWNESIHFIRNNAKEARQILSKRLSLPENIAASATWVNATTTTETSYEILEKTISSAKSAKIIPNDFLLEQDMVLR